MPINRQRVLKSASFSTQISQMLKLDGQEFPLKALANLAVFARAHKHEMNPYLFASHTPSQIIKYLEECENIQQLRRISVYYTELYGYLTRPTFTLHKAKLKQFMEYIDLEAHMTDTMFVRLFSCTVNTQACFNVVVVFGFR